MRNALTSARLAAEPNVIPFIDVLLVLLVIFMATAPKPTTDVNVDAAASGVAAPAEIRPTVISLVQTPRGAVAFVGSREVSVGDLAGAVDADVAATNPALAPGQRRQARIFVQAEGAIPYRHVVTVLDTLQAAGYRRVGVVARADEG